MPVYTVTLTAPNGNRVTRPIVASRPEDAIAEMEVAHDVFNAQLEGLEIRAELVDDPQREVEASLLRMNARNAERERRGR